MNNLDDTFYQVYRLLFRLGTGHQMLYSTCSKYWKISHRYAIAKTLKLKFDVATKHVFVVNVSCYSNTNKRKHDDVNISIFSG